MSNEKPFFRRVQTQSEFNEFIEETNLNSKHFIIKPNWFSRGYAEYTDAKTLELIISSLDGKKTVVEAYTPRNTREINKELENQRFYYTQPWQQLGVLWWSKGDREWIRRSDEKFLREEGFQELFDEYDVDYVNVTEEVWAGDTVDKEEIKSLVERQYSPVNRHELYQWVPKSLYRHKGSVLISFAKIKGVEPLDSIRTEYTPSLALKCLYGLIPHPQRTNFHGMNDCELAQNIVDINKIYQALFNVVGINEAVHTCMVSDPNGSYAPHWGGRYDVIKNSGLVVFGRNLVNLDAFTCKLIAKDPKNVPYLRLAKKVFGDWDKKLIESTTPELRVKYKGPVGDQSFTRC